MNSAPVLLWFRLDLRLADNPALDAAVQRGRPVVPVFIYAPEEEAPWAPGAASRWWLHQSLRALEAQLRARGSRLLLRRGPTLDALRLLLKETGADTVFWNRRYEPAVIARDSCLKESLRDQGVDAQSFNAALLHEPWTVQNQSGNPFQVFTAFWRHCLAKPEPAEPLAAPEALPVLRRWPRSLTLEELELEPKRPWAAGLATAWQPGQAGALANLNRFVSDAFEVYDTDRNRPDRLGTSRLSPHLHFGELSSRQVWASVKTRAERLGSKGWRTSQFIIELGWREFAHHLLFHFPQTPSEPLRTKFNAFAWRHDERALRAWQRGQTGYPIVDAGMRELWTTGWMHNRVRMIVASFLVKDLLIRWQEGARWFWDTLVDADLAQNTLGWQWTSGCGADAAPFFRIFNPTLQGEKFDPEGDYVRRWCPELGRVPRKYLHAPWRAPEAVLHEAQVQLGITYPERIVKHELASAAALRAYGQLA